MGRPTKLTPEVQATICAMLRTGSYLTVAAEAAGVTTRTVYLWMERGEKPGKVHKPYRDFKAAVEEALAEGEARNVALIHRAAQKSWQAAAWLLERQHPERWAKAAERAAMKKQAEEQADGDSDEAGDARTSALAAIDELAARRRSA
jgi:hypothetical protein